jgi:hypothetical protein
VRTVARLIFIEDALEAFMRRAPICGLAATALLIAAWFARVGHPVLFETQTAATFFLTACKGSADDLSAVAKLAEQQNWTSMLKADFSDSDPLKVTGMWRANQNDQSYTVTTGVGPRGATACQVMFEDPKPRRGEFFAALSNAMTLRAEIDQASPSVRTEIYQIEDLAPKYVTLVLMSSPDGSVYHAAVMRPQ